MIMLPLINLISIAIWFFTWLIIGKFVFDRLYYKKISLEMELLSKNNIALGFSFSGFLVGLAISLITAIDPLFPVYINGTTGTIILVVILVLVRLFDLVFMKKIDLPTEIIDKKNVASGIVEGSFFLSIGIIVSGSFVGGDVVSWSSMYIEAIVYSLLGIVLFFISSKIMSFILEVDLEDELLNDNRAVAASFSGLFLGISIVIRDAISGPISGTILKDLGITTLDWFISIVVMIILFYIFDLILFRKFSFKEELKEPNLGVGIIIGSIFLVSSLVSFILAS